MRARFVLFLIVVSSTTIAQVDVAKIKAQRELEKQKCAQMARRGDAFCGMVARPVALERPVPADWPQWKPQTVAIEFIVREDGTVSDSKLLTQDTDEAKKLLISLCEWKFFPAEVDWKPRKYLDTVEVTIGKGKIKVRFPWNGSKRSQSDFCKKYAAARLCAKPAA